MPAGSAGDRCGDLPPCARTRGERRRAALVALWGSDERDRGDGYALHVALAQSEAGLWLTLPLCAAHPRYPDIADLFPRASRMQRAAYDLLGIYAGEGQDHAKWLRHGAWPDGAFPAAQGFRCRAEPFRADEPDAYPLRQGRRRRRA